jgi:transcriptional regulator with XRE-family HTH domain
MGSKSYIPNKTGKKEIPVNFSGKQIKLARISKDMKQVDLAAALSVDHGYDISQKAISSIESGSRAVTDVELALFSKVLNVSVPWLLAGVLEEL